MKHLYLITLVLLLFGCKYKNEDVSPVPSPQPTADDVREAFISGRWRACDYPNGSILEFKRPIVIIHSAASDTMNYVFEGDSIKLWNTKVPPGKVKCEVRTDMTFWFDGKKMCRQ